MNVTINMSINTKNDPTREKRGTIEELKNSFSVNFRNYYTNISKVITKNSHLSKPHFCRSKSFCCRDKTKDTDMQS